MNCVKRVQVRSFFWSIFSRIQFERGKIRTKKTSYLDTFHVVVNAKEKDLAVPVLKL